MKRDLSLREAFFMALILVLILFVTADRTMFRSMKVEFLPQQTQKSQQKKPIKFTFVDLPDDKEAENRESDRF